MNHGLPWHCRLGWHKAHLTKAGKSCCGRSAAVTYQAFRVPLALLRRLVQGRATKEAEGLDTQNCDICYLAGPFQSHARGGESSFKTPCACGLCTGERLSLTSRCIVGSHGASSFSNKTCAHHDSAFCCHIPVSMPHACVRFPSKHK